VHLAHKIQTSSLRSLRSCCAGSNNINVHLYEASDLFAVGPTTPSKFILFGTGTPTGWREPLNASAPQLAQVSKWFAYDVVVNPKTLTKINIPTGPTCDACGKTADAWPHLDLDSIKRDLQDETKMLFRVAWAGARLVAAGETQVECNNSTVERGWDIGLRAEWPYDFVDAETFKAKFMKPLLSKDLSSLPKISLLTPEFVLTTGVLVKKGTLPIDVPRITVFLFSLHSVIRRESLLDASGLLHADHARNVQAWRVGEDVRESGSGRSLQFAVAPRSWSELEAFVKSIEKATKDSETAKQRTMALNDAAQAAALRGDITAASLLTLSTMHSTVSTSKLRRGGDATDAASSGAAASHGPTAPKPPVKRREPMAPPSPKRARLSSAASAASGQTAASKARSGRTSVSGSSQKGLPATLAFASGLPTVAASARAGSQGNASNVGEDNLAGSGDEVDIDALTLPQLVAYIMGPKNYSPGREIRGVPPLVGCKVFSEHTPKLSTVMLNRVRRLIVIWPRRP
jgi:hypothetical protein